ncbi:hypothetical protein [Saccharicrinis aurantiacus]|uniref:hypothetical protein n=1 Tax=Saccharicrinis aurantiacus TaxID=1849719 RepID=UPI00248F8839|nr:hypothetical protein [Saccharicrinis aurantiacus]
MKDIEYFKKRYYIFYDYLIKKQGAAFILEQTKDVFEASYQKKNEKTLRKLDKELDVWLREMLMPSEKEELLTILKKELNETSDEGYLNQIDKIVSKGIIDSKEEYELILQRVESIYDKEGCKSVVDRLNKLLTNYHK